MLHGTAVRQWLLLVRDIDDQFIPFFYTHLEQLLDLASCDTSVSQSTVRRFFAVYSWRALRSPAIMVIIVRTIAPIEGHRWEDSMFLHSMKRGSFFPLTSASDFFLLRCFALYSFHKQCF